MSVVNDVFVLQSWIMFPSSTNRIKMTETNANIWIGKIITIQIPVIIRLVRFNFSRFFAISSFSCANFMQINLEVIVPLGPNIIKIPL